jgi:hypothetical protein
MDGTTFNFEIHDGEVLQVDEGGKRNVASDATTVRIIMNQYSVTERQIKKQYNGLWYWLVYNKDGQVTYMLPTATFRQMVTVHADPLPLPLDFDDNVPGSDADWESSDSDVALDPIWELDLDFRVTTEYAQPKRSDPLPTPSNELFA